MNQLGTLLVVLDDVASSSAPITEENFIDKLIPNWTSFVTQVSALIIMIILVIIVGYKPVKKMLKKRQDYIEASILDAEVAKKQAERDAAQASEMIIASKKEASEIIKSAEADASRRSEDMIEQTNAQIAKMKQDADKDIARSRQEALDDIHDEIVSVALSATSEVLKREINEKDNSRIVEDFIKDME
ncbi:MAG: F0F1 ATP synthase subunit B [Bacilli bacterium]|nr:F0F1 ATP synthase subunit B [Bacilli bacterium]